MRRAFNELSPCQSEDEESCISEQRLAFVFVPATHQVPLQLDECVRRDNVRYQTFHLRIS